METYIEYCKDFIENHINGCEGQDYYGSELGNTITEGINVDGSATYCTETAKEYIKEWYDEAGDVYQYQKDNYGEVLHNPFESPEAFHVCMIIEGVDNILSQCKTIDNLWGEEFLLDKKTIKKILKEVKEVKEVTF